MWVATNDLPRSAAHPFYTRLNQVLDQHDFDGFVEGLCERFYAHEGQPRLPPGRYFRLLPRIRLPCASFSGWCCRRRVPRCIAIGGASVARGACACCGSAANVWSGPSRISTKRAACRVHLRGHTNILKRLLIHTGGFDLGLLMRQLIGVGTRASCRAAPRRRGGASSVDWIAQDARHPSSTVHAADFTAQASLDCEIGRRPQWRTRNGFHHGLLA
jgi:hypothetical protein